MRLREQNDFAERMWFQFTHPGKGATRTQPHIDIEVRVSIHAPWEGCDEAAGINPYLALGFNSRTLGRVRQRLGKSNIPELMFQFTHPGKGATKIIYVIAQSIQFQFTHPGKGATHLKVQEQQTT